MAHFILSVVVLLLYGISILTGHTDDTLRNVLMIVFGYWFGAVGGAKVRDVLNSKKSKDGDTKDGGDTP